jgi:hypothetical protein
MDLEFICPHCNESFIVNQNEINCAIFRHAVYRNSMMPINPHESLENCMRLIEEGKVYGCAKPFKLVRKDDKWEVEICDYI